MHGNVYYQCKEHWFEVVKEWSTAVFYTSAIVAAVVSLYSWLRIAEIWLGLGLCILPVGHLAVELVRRDNIRYELVELDGQAFVYQRETKLNPFKGFPFREVRDTKEIKPLISEGNIFSTFFGFRRVWVQLGQATVFKGLRVPVEFVERYWDKPPKPEDGEEDSDAVAKLKILERMLARGIIPNREGLELVKRLLTT